MMDDEGSLLLEFLRAEVKRGQLRNLRDASGSPNQSPRFVLTVPYMCLPVVQYVGQVHQASMNQPKNLSCISPNLKNHSIALPESMQVRNALWY